MKASKAFPRTKQSIAFALSDLYLCRISTTTTDTIFNYLALIHVCNLSPPLSPPSSSLSLSPLQVGRVEIGSFWLHGSKLEPENRPTFAGNLQTNAQWFLDE